MATNPEKLKHLYLRAGFGTAPEGVPAGDPLEAQVARLCAFTEAPVPLQAVSPEEWAANSPKAVKMMKEQLSADTVKQMERTFRQKTRDLNLLWLQEMVRTQEPLREKMALFWHGHFATRSDNPYFDQLLLQELRTHCLGRFSDLLSAVAKSPSMLKFLNNQQNRKQHPNENFAREVMELFTLGRGHYTEGDIREAARAFTGWAYNDEGQFRFNARQHDEGSKTFFGKTGNFNGDDILKMLLEQEQTAIFVVTKIYRFFVDEEPDDKQVRTLARRFYSSGYDIGKLMKDIFSASWFYSREHTGTLIKSPVELLVGLQRIIPLTFGDGKQLLNLQRILGQQLFYPPNVAGWPGGKAWIDSSSLVIRLSLAEALLGSKELDLHAKGQDAEMDMNGRAMTGSAQKEQRFRLKKVMADWTPFLQRFEQEDQAALPQAINEYLLSPPVGREQLKAVLRYADASSRTNYIKSLTILLLSLPEYQLC